MPAEYRLELEGEVLRVSPDKDEIREAGAAIAQRAILEPPIQVGSATIVGLSRGGHLSWELEEKSGHILELRVNKVIADPTPVHKQRAEEFQARMDEIH